MGRGADGMAAGGERYCFADALVSGFGYHAYVVNAGYAIFAGIKEVIGLRYHLAMEVSHKPLYAMGIGKPKCLCAAAFVGSIGQLLHAADIRMVVGFDYQIMRKHGSAAVAEARTDAR